MTKIYRAESIVAVCVSMGNGINRRVKFDECMNGSVFATDDVQLQKALENSPCFNDWYYLSENYEAQPPEQEEEAIDEPATTVKVSSVAEARDYLVDNYEMSRTSLRNKEAVLTAAKSVGVTFEGLK